MSTAENYAQNLWQLANLLTGFSVAEVLVVSVTAASSREFGRIFAKNARFARIGVLIGHAVLCVVIVICHMRELQLLGPNTTKLIAETVYAVAMGQIVILIVATLLFLRAISRAVKRVDTKTMRPRP